MGQISVTPEELKQEAQVYIRSKDAIEAAIQEVNRMNDIIAQQWKGQAFQSYLEQYNQLYQNVQKFEELLENINQQLNKYADTVAERDAQAIDYLKIPFLGMVLRDMASNYNHVADSYQEQIQKLEDKLEMLHQFNSEVGKAINSSINSLKNLFGGKEKYA